MLLEGLGGRARRGGLALPRVFNSKWRFADRQGFSVRQLSRWSHRLETGSAPSPDLRDKVPLAGRMLRYRTVVDGVEQVLDVATSQSSSAAKEATSLRSQAVKVMWPKQC